MMKRLLFLALSLAAAQAAATPLAADSVHNMGEQIDSVMDRRLCAVAGDTRKYPGATILVLMPPPVGPRRVAVDDYNWMRNTGYAKTRAGKWLMRDRMERSCRADGESGRCIAFRSYFSQFPVAERPPGAGVPAR